MVEQSLKSGGLPELLAGFSRDAMDHALARNTQSTQCSAVNAWDRFCKCMGIDKFCKGYTLDEMICFVSAFIAFEIGLRKMNPNSIQKTYLGAISAFFCQNSIGNYFAEAVSSKYVKYLLKGYLRVFHAMHPKGEAAKLAFTIELVKYVEVAITGSDIQERRRPLFIKAAVLAIKFGIYHLLRKS